MHQCGVAEGTPARQNVTKTREPTLTDHQHRPAGSSTVPPIIERPSLASALTVAIGSALQGRPYATYSSDVRVHVAATHRTTYPDFYNRVRTSRTGARRRRGDYESHGPRRGPFRFDRSRRPRREIRALPSPRLAPRVRARFAQGSHASRFFGANSTGGGDSKISGLVRPPSSNRSTCLSLWTAATPIRHDQRRSAAGQNWLRIPDARKREEHRCAARHAHL